MRETSAVRSWVIRYDWCATSYLEPLVRGGNSFVGYLRNALMFSWLAGEGGGAGEASDSVILPSSKVVAYSDRATDW